MRISGSGWFAILILAGVPGACQVPPAHTPPGAIATATTLPPDEDQRAASSPAPIDWAGTGDCLDQLKLVHATAEHSRLEKAPFAVVLATPSTSFEWVRASAVPLIADLPLESSEDQGPAAVAAPCLIVVDQPGEVRAAHRVVDFQTVASQYQSGIRSGKNPDYEAAQARVREAERDAKKRGSSILRVGDPMLDLVGLVVGGVIATFGQIGSDDDLDEALAALKETPRSRDRPVYRAYEFERSTVRAGKEATIEVALRDLKRGGIWHTQLRQREMREFAVLEGLDPRDPDYEQHRAGALSWQELEHWQQQPPQLPMSALVAALVERGGTEEGPRTNGSEVVADAPSAGSSIEWLAADEPVEQETSAVPTPVAALAPSGGPTIASTPSGSRPRAAQDSPPSTDTRAPRSAGERTVLAAALDPRVASVVRLEAAGRRGSGFYVKPRLVVTTADLVGSSSVIDVTTSDGEAVLGLVVHADPDRQLALVHVPRAGRAAQLLDTAALRPGDVVDVLELVDERQARLTRATLAPAPAVGAGPSDAAPVLHLTGDAAETGTGAPVFLNDRAIALLGAKGSGPERNVIFVEALDTLLESGTLAVLH